VISTWGHCVEKSRSQRREHTGSDALVRADTKRAGVAGVERSQVGLGGLEPGSDRIRVPEQELARLGQRNPTWAARAVDQPLVDDPLERRYLLADQCLGLAYLVAVGSLLGFTGCMWLLRAAPTSLVGTYAYVNPVVAVLLGTILLGESLTWRTLAGGGIIVASVALIVRAPKRSQRTTVDPGGAPVPARGR
jgi:hypothetical protein